MPYPNDLIIEDGQNKMIMDELSYDRGKLEEEFQRLFQGLTTEQRGIYNEIMSAVSRGKGGVFFVYGYGGTVGGPNDGEADIEIPREMFVDGGHDPIATIVESTYPDIADHIWEPSYFQERAILAPTNEIAETVNDHVLSQLPGEERTYLSSDAISVEEGNFGIHEMYSTEFLNTIKCGGLPNHSIRLKVGAPVMLLRNIDQSSGLCNGTRLVVKHLGDRIIEAIVVSGSNLGNKSSFHE
ncbi:uncharacterized protein LOC104905551 [Beta vulgaris subsp. vulgaris]|uniref:uncharacterized protein LOC104905551 n=1 Tax=Beta vulgaris subsp. vulgaris TaxID=3555 RepID=UPI0025484896|nr:uncharacterized protein LOC104905551 [Beta vulgaris subsp. vulgaris]